MTLFGRTNETTYNNFHNLFSLFSLVLQFSLLNTACSRYGLTAG